MKPQVMLALSATLLASMLTGCGSSQPSAAASNHAQRPTTPPAGGAAIASATPDARVTSGTPIGPCGAGALSLGYGPGVSPVTGEHGVLYVLVNHGAVACTLNGYPEVALDDANGKPLPFHYVHGHGQYVTSKPPSTVALAPGASASILVAKYRCDVGEDRTAVTIRLTLPDPQHFVLTARASSDGAGVSTMSYCRGGPTDPGQTVEVSPIEPTMEATQRPLSG